MLKTTLPSVHNLCTKKCRSPGPCPSMRFRHTSVRITSGLSTSGSRRVQMLPILWTQPASQAQQQISPLLPETWVGRHPAKKYPIQEIFLAAEKGADMCRWQQGQKRTGWIQVMSSSESISRAHLGNTGPQEWSVWRSGPHRCATVNLKIDCSEWVNWQIFSVLGLYNIIYKRSGLLHRFNFWEWKYQGTH
jgi:hypothetical protein